MSVEQKAVTCMRDGTLVLTHEGSSNTFDLAASIDGGQTWRELRDYLGGVLIDANTLPIPIEINDRYVIACDLVSGASQLRCFVGLGA